MRISLINIDNKNEEHLEILRLIALSSRFLGKVGSNLKGNKDTFYNNEYLVVLDGNIIGYLGLSNLVETKYGNNVSLYYGILQKYYGNGYGKLIVDLVKENLKKYNNVDNVIAMVDVLNTYSKNVIEACDFDLLMETDEEYVYGYKMRQ